MILPSAPANLHKIFHKVSKVFRLCGKGLIRLKYAVLTETSEHGARAARSLSYVMLSAPMCLLLSHSCQIFLALAVKPPICLCDANTCQDLFFKQYYIKIINFTKCQMF